MQKLTREQEVWVIDELINKTGGLGRDFSVAKSEIKEILGRCTAISFTEFNFMHGFLRISHTNENSEHCVRVDVGRGATPIATKYLTIQELKDFFKRFNDLMEIVNEEFN